MNATTVYRDAAYSADTQELLRRLLGRLTGEAGWLEGERGEEIQALTDVIERWDRNDATELVVEDVRPAYDFFTLDARPRVSGDPKFADSGIVVYELPCPHCDYGLEWAIETPPIPMTLFSWFDPNGEGRRIHECPSCAAALPEGDLTKEDTR